MTSVDAFPPAAGGHVVALCGGVGGAKLAAGLAAALDARRGTLTVAVNTGDDFEHLGLPVCPDLDSVLYALGGLNDPVRGWGRADESWHFMAALAGLGGDDWFALGDRDLAVHVLRRHRLLRGDTLTDVTAAFAERCAIRARLLPMSDDPVRTVVHTDAGALPFQHYFVKHRCAPVVRAIAFAGAAQARANPHLLDALARPDLQAVVICPSNPYLSIDPILAVPGIRDALHAARAPIVAVSPIVGGEAVKGPTAKIMRELGVEIAPSAVAAHYRDLLDGFVVDTLDAHEAARIPVATDIAQTVMRTAADRLALGESVLGFARALVVNGTHAVAAEAAR